MTNHPDRKPAQQRMTPAQLRDLLARSGITQQRAAELAGVQLRTLKQYAAPETLPDGARNPGHRAMPLSASGLLCLSCILLGAPAALLLPWLPPSVAAVYGGKASATA